MTSSSRVHISYFRVSRIGRRVFEFFHILIICPPLFLLHRAHPQRLCVDDPRPQYSCDDELRLLNFLLREIRKSLKRTVRANGYSTPLGGNISIDLLGNNPLSTISVTNIFKIMQGPAAPRIRVVDVCS